MVTGDLGLRAGADGPRAPGAESDQGVTTVGLDRQLSPAEFRQHGNVPVSIMGPASLNTHANQSHSMDDRSDVHSEPVEPGELVYDSNSRLVGRVSGLTNDGFEAETGDFDGSEMTELPGQEFGEGYLMWRCTECGEMSALRDGLPESCPGCAAPREAISVIQED